MGNYKGNAVLILDQLLRQHDPEARELFLASLTPGGKEAYLKILPITWVPIEEATALSVKAAHVLFPKEPDALFRLGKARAIASASGFNKIFFRFMSVEAMIKRVSNLWGSMHDQGSGRAEYTTGRNETVFCVEQYPTLPKEFRIFIQGFICGLHEMAGKKMVRTEKDESNPACWRWRTTWS